MRKGLVLILVAVTIGITLGMMSPTVSAQGITVETDQFKIDGYLCDFGSGSHVAFHPTGDASVTWNYATTNGSLVATARVRGTLYVDALNAGSCAHLTMKFRDGNSDLSTRTFETQCPAPGGDANLSANQLRVDESFASSNLNNVFLQIDHVQPTGSLYVSSSPGIKRHNFTVNNGSSDFGTGIHAAGTPTGNAVVQLSRESGNVTGLVNGTLYWDSLFSQGCTQMIVDFETLSGSNLSSKTIKKCGSGGNANDAVNHTDVNQSYTSGSLMQIRLRVGVVLPDGSFQSVKKKVCDFKACKDL